MTFTNSCLDSLPSHTPYVHTALTLFCTEGAPFGTSAKDLPSP